MENEMRNVEETNVMENEVHEANESCGGSNAILAAGIGVIGGMLLHKHVIHPLNEKRKIRKNAKKSAKEHLQSKEAEKEYSTDFDEDVENPKMAD